MAAPETTPVLAIVGAGFSGTLLASQLLRQARPWRLLLIERTGHFGSGVAYGTQDPGHLLNVSTGGMSAWPEDPSHLLRWLDLNQAALADLLPEPIDASGFLPRRVYGLYLQSVLKEAEALAAGRSTLQRLLSLPAEMLVYPCHDDQGRSHSSIGEERRLNPKLAGRNREAFIQLMQQQRLAPPKRIAEALPANRHLGDLQPAGQHDQEIQERQRQQEQAQATEEANREIYNAFLGMFI